MAKKPTEGKATARPYFVTPASSASKALSRSVRTLPIVPAARRLAQNEECKCTGGETRGRRGLGQNEMTFGLAGTD
jgi:hypothetical protein